MSSAILWSILLVSMVAAELHPPSGVAPLDNDYDKSDVADELAFLTQEALETLRSLETAPVARSRGRRDDDTPFRMCGVKLLQHIIDRGYCNPWECGERTKRSADVFSSRTRRAPDSKKISNLCCNNMCRPSAVRALCCSNSK